MSRHALDAEAGTISATSAYLERSEQKAPWHDRAADALVSRLWRPIAGRLRNPAAQLERIVTLAAAHEADYRAMSDGELQAHVKPLKAALRRHGFEAACVGQCFALLREAAARRIGQRPYDVQLMGAWALLQGRLAEMATGEGKTLTATLAVGTAALAGVPVHVITVNDYLAARDAEAMAPIYEFLGLSVGTVVHGLSPDERRRAYRCDVTHCTNKELAFDYLKDRVALARSGGRLTMAVAALQGGAGEAERLLLRGLHFAVVDEADSVFIDEARTPLILSANFDGQHELAMYQAALAFARRLEPGRDYVFNEPAQRVELGDAGRARVAELAQGLDGVWTSTRGRQELVVQALTALLVFHRDKQYVLADGKVQIVDEFTGRVMADRSWESGLHQMIEAKEGCALSPRRVTLARITYQRLFRRYLRLAGMTGTAAEVAREVWAVYRLRSVTIPLHRPSARVCLPGCLHATAAQKWQAIVASVRELALRQGRPVLLGTRSVEASEQLSLALAEAGIAHRLLNAKQDKEEAAVVAEAGLAGRVTVATNLAGRGTDIRLGPGVAERGGLHVILTECHGSARVDRQLIGRGARQGDPGSCQMIVSAEDEVLRVFAGPLLWLASSAASGPRLLGAARFVAQRRAEWRDSRLRRQTLKMDAQLEQTLAFSGTHE